jgi:cytochrome c-type biogenesis protein CcmH/NrfG
MRARTAALLLGAVLVFYLAGCVWRGVLALQTAFTEGSLAAGVLGCCVLAFGVVGAWFLWREIQFGYATERLALALDEDESPGGGLRYEEIDGLPRSQGGRVDRSAADALFAKRKAETEASPEDWRCWYRLAAAYHAAKDSSRARAAMRHAISLHP